MTVTCRESAVVTGLELGKRHAVRIHRDGRQRESFFFSFERYSADRLCLNYGPGYGT